MTIKSIKEMLEDKSSPPEEIIGGGILLQRSLLLITGESKAKKSMLAYNLAIALATGHPFVFFEIQKQSRVLVLTAEGGYYPNKERIVNMSKSVELDEKTMLNVCFDTRIKLEDESDYNELKSLITNYKPEVLIIDPLVKFHHMDENSAREMNIVLEKIRNLIEDHNISIILIHHLGKNPMNGARGSSTILGEYDSCITIHKGDKQQRHRCEFDLRHSITPPVTYLRFNEQTNWFEFDEVPVIKVLRSYGSMAKKDLVDLLLADNYYKKNTSAYRAIDNEHKKGLIVLDENGIYTLKLFDVLAEFQQGQ